MLIIGQIWCTVTLSPVYVLNPYLETGAGDLFSLVWSSSLQTLYIGCQNTSLQWYDFSPNSNTDPATLLASCAINGSPDILPTSTSFLRKAHKFFDSYPQYERRPADINAMNGSPPTSIQDSECADPKTFLSVPAANVIDSAHFGYVYCMALLPPTRQGSDDVFPAEDVGEQERAQTRLITGSGDETVKVHLPQPLPGVLRTNSVGYVALGMHIQQSVPSAYI